MKNNYASIDLGSNSCRLLIADSDGNYLYMQDYATKLGEGLFQTKRLSDEAIKRAIEAFCDFAKKLKEFDVPSGNVRAIATASCRIAENAEVLVRDVRENAGINIEIIDGKEEAILNLRGGIMNVLGRSKYVIIYDLGGASTEVTLATNEENPRILYTISIPWGSRNASEAYDLSVYNEENAAKLSAEIKKYMKDFIVASKYEEYKADAIVVATSSTPLRLVAMAENSGSYDRNVCDGKTVSCAKADELIAGVFASSAEEIYNNPYIGQQRATVFVAACTIFQTIYKELGAKEFTASLKSAKDAIIQNFLESKNG